MDAARQELEDQMRFELEQEKRMNHQCVTCGYALSWTQMVDEDGIEVVGCNLNHYMCDAFEFHGCKDWF